MAFVLSQAVKDKITEIILTTNPEVFIVEISMKRQRTGLLLIRIDTDNGITMDECLTISRAVNKWLDETDPFEFDYHLEVTSPGLGEPLLLHRQYVKEIGKKIRVIGKTGNVWEGVLQAVGEAGVEVEQEKPKKKKKDETEVETKQIVPFSEIKEAKIIF